MLDTKITNSLTQSVLQTIQKFNCRNVEKSDPILGISLEREGFPAGETGKMANKKPPEALRLQVVFQWSCYPDSNWRPHPYQGCALPTEL
jgi:hypothetical protein